MTFEAKSTLCELLAACLHGKSTDDFVVTREDGKPVRDFRDTWAKVCKAAGSPGLLFHDLRRTAARNLRRAGVAENVIMQIGGWRTRSVFDRYAIITENDIVDAVRKLEADLRRRFAGITRSGSRARLCGGRKLHKRGYSSPQEFTS